MKSAGPRSVASARLIAAMLILAALIVPISTPTASAASSLHWLYASGSATGGKRISLRVVLTEPAPPGGAPVALASTSPLIPVPTTITVPAGETERRIGVTTVPTYRDTNVTVTATYGGVSRSKVILIKEPRLSSLSVQSRIRAGGNGKIVVRLSGRAPSGGIVVFTGSNRPSVLPVAASASIAPGAASVTLIVPAADVNSDVFVNVIARYDGIRLVQSTIVRDYFDTEAAATATAIANQTSTAVANQTATAVANQTATETANQTATAIAIHTSTAVANQSATAAAHQTATAAAEATATAEANASATAFANQTATAAANLTATAAAAQTPTASVPSATPTPTATITATATAGPPDFSIQVMPDPVETGQASQLTVCWTNPVAGGGLGPVYAGATANNSDSPNPSQNLAPNFNNSATWSFSEADSCETTAVTGVQVGSAYWAMELGAGNFKYLGPITIVAGPTATPTDTAVPTATLSATDTPVPTATSTATATATATPIPAATATNTPTPTATNTAVPTAAATNTAIPTSTATITPEPTATATNNPAPTPTNTPLPTATNTPEPTATDTAVPTPTATNTSEPTATATNTLEPTSTSTAEPTATNTALPTATHTPEPTATDTPAPTPTNSPLPTATNTQEPTATSTAEPTATTTPVPPATNTPVPTATATDIPVPTATNTAQATATDTPVSTSTPTATPTSTASNTPEPTAPPTETPTPTVTATPEPPTFSFLIADNSLLVGDQTSVEICWTNPEAGSGVSGAYTYANGSAGPSATFTSVLSPNFNSGIMVSFTAETPCVQPVFTATAVGRAWIALEHGFPDVHMHFSEPIDVASSLVRVAVGPFALDRRVGPQI